MKNQKKMLPDQRSGESVENYIDRTWNSDPAIKSEFENDKECYTAWCRAEAAGAIRLLGKESDEA
ncbi:MAG: hypothetical protein JRJ62_03315 [Deltaproteobacteria bacterium]|nr:hypothetical protein [Deltaproteobacteria bacterium]MBW2090347.1 hypothetical protein [Deltaproteobacteria bacterium]